MHLDSFTNFKIYSAALVCRNKRNIKYSSVVLKYIYYQTNKRFLSPKLFCLFLRSCTRNNLFSLSVRETNPWNYIGLKSSKWLKNLTKSRKEGKKKSIPQEWNLAIFLHISILILHARIDIFHLHIKPHRFITQLKDTQEICVRGRNQI